MTADALFQNAIANMAEYKNNSLGTTMPFVTTATIVCTVNVEQIDLEDVKANPLLVVRIKKNTRKLYRYFSNSVTLLFDKTKAVKVFVNGKLHITGCTRIAQAVGYAEAFCRAMKWPDAVKVIQTDILTLNTSYKISPRRNIRLDKFYQTIVDKADANITARYNPDIYQGLVMKVMHPITGRKITALIFYTGSVMLTGVRTHEELTYSFITMMNTLERVSDQVLYDVTT